MLLLLTGWIMGPRIACAQFALHSLDTTALPPEIKYTGHVLEAVRWTDSLGDNIVVTSETGFQPSMYTPDDSYKGSYRDAAIYACHYLVEGGVYRLTWRVSDNIHECGLELKANFVPKTFAVTDLDHNGRAEVWLMYKVACEGGVDPVPMRIVMYEGDKRFAAKGTSKVPSTKGGWAGGNYSLDEAFRDGPEVFRKYAETLWKAHEVETLE